MSRYGNTCEMAISRSIQRTKALIADDFCGPLARPNKAQCKGHNNHPSLHAVVMWENEVQSGKGGICRLRVMWDENFRGRRHYPYCHSTDSFDSFLDPERLLPSYLRAYLL